MRLVTVAPAPIYLNTLAQVNDAVDHTLSADVVGVDTETIGLMKDERGLKYHLMTDQPVCMGLSPDEDTRYYVPRHFIGHFKPFLESRVPKAFSNYKFDKHRIANACGVRTRGPILDTVVMDYLYDEDTRENRHGLKDVALSYLQLPMAEYKDLFGSLDPRLMSERHEQWPKYLDYATLDPWATRKGAIYLRDRLLAIPVWAHPWVDPDELTPQQLSMTMLDLYWEYEEPQLHTLWNMERRGIPVNQQHLRSVAASLERTMSEASYAVASYLGRPLNLGSVQKVNEVLYNEFRYPVLKRTATKAPSTDEAVLTQFAYGELQCFVSRQVLIYRSAQKSLGTYVEGLLKWVHTDGRIHTSYSPTKLTGRLGSSEPNLQNLPQPADDVARIRFAFVSGEGKVFIVADYSQIEMRIMAVLASTYGDYSMLDEITQGLDIHSSVGCKIMDLPYDKFIEIKNDETHPDYAACVAARSAAKSIGFGIIYGIGAPGLSVQLSKIFGRYVDVREAEAWIERFLVTRPGIRDYMADMKRQAVKNGFVQTLAGRFRRLSKAKSKNRQEAGHAKRQSINTPVQGSAADIVKIAMILLDSDAYLRDVLGFEVLIQVHDELVLLGPEEHAEEALTIVKHTMENPLPEGFPVHLKVDAKVCRNLEEGK